MRNYLKNSRTEDLRQYSCIKQKNMNFIGSNGESRDNSGKVLTDLKDKKVSYDDLEELHSITKSPLNDISNLNQQLYKENYDEPN